MHCLENYLFKRVLWSRLWSLRMYTIFSPEDTDVTKLLKSQLALCECLSDGRHAPFFEANFSVFDSQVLNERIGRQEDYLGVQIECEYSESSC